MPPVVAILSKVSLGPFVCVLWIVMLLKSVGNWVGTCNERHQCCVQHVCVPCCAASIPVEIMTDVALLAEIPPHT